MLQHRLSARPEITTVQPGDLRAAIVKAKLRAPSILSLEQLRELSDALGTSLFLRGTILAYGGPDPSGAAAPVELYLTLIEARSGRIMWSGLHRRAGSDGLTVQLDAAGGAPQLHRLPQGAQQRAHAVRRLPREVPPATDPARGGG